MTAEGQNPYRGPFSYKENDEDIFFGRNTEVDELITLIRKNQLTVLYGASGTGKTSLIHAKLLPQLKREFFHPIYIRINFAADDEDPLHSIQKRVVEELRIWDNNIPGFQTGQSLIQYASKNVIFRGLVKPVLFFDQFEELFTLGPKIDPYKIHRFMFQLSELIELRLTDDLKTLDYINNISSFKVVFSLRQDWIGFLDDFIQLIPSIGQVRYRLKKFSPAQAMEAIMCPSKNIITEKTAEEIIKHLGTPALWREDISLQNFLNKDLVNKEIDPFILSLYCYQLFDKCIGQGYTQITTEFVLEHNNTELIRKYYEEKIESYKDVRFLIEEKLLDDSGKRLIVPFNKFTAGKGVIEELTSKVARETGIVRIIGVGKESEIEIVHDRLALQIFESKNDRALKEKQEEADKKKQEAETLKQSAQRAKRKTFMVSIAAALIILLLIAFSIKIYIDFRNDHTLIGLKDQLSYERANTKRAEDSIIVLNGLIQDGNSGLSKIHSETPVTNEQALKKHDNLIREQESTIDSLSKEKIVLAASLDEKDQKIENLKNSQSVLTETIQNLEAKLNSVLTTKIDNSIIRKFEKRDFSNLRILNATNPDGSYDFNDIKNNGFKFSFNIAPILEDEKGKIEIRVFYKISRTNSSYELDFKPMQNMQALEQPIKYVIKVPKADIKPGAASYEVKYFIDRDKPQTTLVLDRGNFKISRPPTQLNE